MIPTFKAEFRRLFSVRSTYFLLAFAALALFAITFYFEGYRLGSGALSAHSVERVLLSNVGLAAVFVNIIGILYVGHEYRYNTIMYTLTANAHRTSVLMVKALTMVVFGLVAGLIFAGLSIGFFMLGLLLRDTTLPAQDFHLIAELSKTAFYFAAYGLIGVLVTVALRSLIAAIVFMLLFPIMFEGLISSLIKSSAEYLPFTALDSIMTGGGSSAGKAFAVVGAYICGLLLISWILFMRRDATAQ